MKFYSITIFAIWLFLTPYHQNLTFLNGLQEIIWFGHSAIFWPFLKIEENCIFKACFGEIWAKHAIFYEILPLNLVILTNLGFIWAFLFFERFGPYESTHVQIWTFKFFLDLATLRKTTTVCYKMMIFQTKFKICYFVIQTKVWIKKPLNDKSIFSLGNLAKGLYTPETLCCVLLRAYLG